MMCDYRHFTLCNFISVLARSLCQCMFLPTEHVLTMFLDEDEDGLLAETSTAAQCSAPEM